MIYRPVSISLAVLTLASCASRQPKSEVTAEQGIGTRIGTVSLDTPVSARLERAIAAADSATRLGAARLAGVEVHPDSLHLRVGARYPLISLTVVFRDSTGSTIKGIVPHYSVSAPIARITNEFELEAVQPGRVEILIRASTRGVPRRQDAPTGVVGVIIVE